VSGLEINPPAGTSAADRFLGGTLYDLSFAGPAGPVTVEAGARIAALDGGRITLLGGRVENGGTLEAPDGQVFLAAGSSISLARALDLTAVRGRAPPSSTFSPVGAADGVALNTGIISAPRGNITMVGGQTLQHGLLTATTGAQSNGSIFLGADGF